MERNAGFVGRFAEPLEPCSPRLTAYLFTRQHDRERLGIFTYLVTQVSQYPNKRRTIRTSKSSSVRGVGIWMRPVTRCWQDENIERLRSSPVVQLNDPRADRSVGCGKEWPDQERGVQFSRMCCDHGVYSDRVFLDQRLVAESVPPVGVVDECAPGAIVTFPMQICLDRLCHNDRCRTGLKLVNDDASQPNRSVKSRLAGRKRLPAVHIGKSVDPARCAQSGEIQMIGVKEVHNDGFGCNDRRCC